MSGTAEVARTHVVERCAALGIAVVDTPYMKINEEDQSAVVYKIRYTTTPGEDPAVGIEHLAADALSVIVAITPFAVHITSDWVADLGQGVYEATLHVFERLTIID